MAGGISSNIKGFMFILFFTFLIGGFVYFFLLETNPSSPVLSYGGGMIQKSMADTQGSINLMNSTIGESLSKLNTAGASPVQYLFLISEAFMEIPKLMLYPFISGFNLISNFLYPALGNNSAFAMGLTLLLAGLFIGLVFYIIKFIRTGESER